MGKEKDKVLSHATGGWYGNSKPTFKSVATMGNNSYDMTGGAGNAKAQEWQQQGNDMNNAQKGGTAGTGEGTPGSSQVPMAPTSDQALQQQEISNPVASGMPVAPKYIIPRNIKEAQAQVIDRQNRIAVGQNSITDLQYRQGLDDIAKAQTSAVASARGVSNAGLLNRSAIQAGQQAGMDLTRDMAIAKATEQRKSDDMISAIAAAANGVSMQRAVADQQAATAQRGQNMQMIGDLAASASKASSSSDENSKTNIRPSKSGATNDVTEFMDAMKSYMYEYKKDSKQPGGKPTPEGQVKSVMAQDLEKSDLGKQMVTNTPNGKVVDYGQGMAPLFAAIAELNERTKHLSKGK